MYPERVNQISPFIVMEVLEKAQQMERSGENIIHLEVGEPDFDTPAGIVEAAKTALNNGETHYTHSLGIWELREAVANHYKRKYQVEVDPAQVIITSGTSPGLLLLLSALLHPGDEVICSNPGYACYPNFVQYLDASINCIHVSEENGFQYRTEDVTKCMTRKTKAILINSPSNPTGNLLSPEIMQEISALGPIVISDEIYHGLVYEEQEHSILEFTSNAVVLNGFSKLYAMTGWRLGYLIVPEHFVRPIQKLLQNFFISANAFVQRGGAAALTAHHPEVDQMIETYNQRRKYMLSRLKEIGFKVAVEPKGAFYILANAKQFTSDSYKFAFDILEHAKVAVTPGIDFGSNGEGFLRFSYANSLENIRIGMERLERYLESR